MRTILIALLCAWIGASGCRAAEGGRGTAAGTWRLIELGTLDLTRLARTPELTIGADGALSGFAGVNRFSGSADPEALREGKLCAGPLIATRMGGPPEAMEAETQLLALLGVPLEWRRKGAELELREGGSVRARLAALD
jgi:heat shock protein HslJ